MCKLVHSVIYLTYNYANDAATICLNMDDEGKVAPVDKVGHRSAHYVYILPRQHNSHFLMKPMRAA